MSRDPKFFVRRASDNSILCRDKRWRQQVADVGDIKLYATAGIAERYGLKGCREVPSVSDGSLTTRGTVYAVYPDEILDRCGNIYDQFHNLKSKTEKRA